MALDNEQHFILRVQNPELANTLRAWLRDKANIEGDVRLLFESHQDREGVLTVDGVEHRVVLQNLPAVVESYKTLDDANLVKVADIGQVLLVVDPAVMGPDEATAYLAPDGVTPPMRKARSRQFRPPITLPQAHVKEAVNDVLEMLAGRAPDGYVFTDHEEEYVIDPATGKGTWQRVKPSKQQRAAAVAAAEVSTTAAAHTTNKGARAGRAANRRKGAAAADDSGDDEMLEMTDSD